VNRLPVIVGASLIVVVIILFLLPYSSRWIPVCGFCHATKKEHLSWKKSSHHKVNCVTCHYKSGAIGFLSMELKGFRNLERWVLKSKPQVNLRVSDNPCRRCHKRVENKTVESRGIRMSHKEVTKGWRCSQCHGSVGHTIKASETKRASMDKCFNCHDDEEATVSCKLCHQSRVNAPRSPRKSGAIAHISGWEKNHGGSKIFTCSFCHENSFCQKCHPVNLSHTKDWPFFHGERAKQAEEACYKCHDRLYCESCHQLSMPHPQNYLTNHSGQAKSFGEKACFRCHSPENCDVCHVEQGLGPLF